jgi:hypothetical protein
LIGLILLGIALPPVRLAFLVWWLASLAIRRSRLLALPPVVQLGYRLRRRSGRPRWVVLLVVVVAVTLLVGAIVLVSRYA